MNEPSQILDQRYGMLKSISKQMYLAKINDLERDPIILQKAAMEWAMDDQKVDIWYNLNKNKLRMLNQDERLDEQEKRIWKWSVLQQADDPIYIPQGQKEETPLDRGLKALQVSRAVTAMGFSPEEAETVRRGAGLPAGEDVEDAELKLYDMEAKFNQQFVEVKEKGVEIGGKRYAKNDPRTGKPTNMTASDKANAERVLREIELRRNKVNRLKGQQVQGQAVEQEKQRIALDAPPTPELGSMWSKLSPDQQKKTYKAYEMGLSPATILAAVQKELGVVENTALEKTKELAGKESVEIPNSLKGIYEKATSEQKAKLLEAIKTGKGKKAIIAEIGGEE